MPRRKVPVPKAEVQEIDWWDKEVDGILLRFVISRVTREEPERWQRSVDYPVKVRRADDPYLSVHDAFDEMPTREQVEQRFSSRNLKKTFERLPARVKECSLTLDTDEQRRLMGSWGAERVS